MSIIDTVRAWLTPAAVAPAIAAVEAEAPQKTVTVVHAMLAAIEKHEAGHPVLLSMTQYVDGLIATKGEAMLADVEKAVLTALAIRYPALALLLPSLTPATDPKPAA